MSWAWQTVAPAPGPAITRLGGVPLAQIGGGIDRDAVQPKLEMKVRAGARAGAAGLPERLPGCQPMTRNDIRTSEMCVEDRVATAHIDGDDIMGKPSGGILREPTASRAMTSPMTGRSRLCCSA